jgi:polyisoprenoid-binding protein YceI
MRTRSFRTIPRALHVIFRLVVVAGLAASTLVAASSSTSIAQPPSKTGAPKTNAATTAKKPASVNSAKADAALPVVYVTSGEGNLARYRVRERLAGMELDNDAIGETPKVSGSISLDKNGKIVPGESGFSADISLLTSDQARRDNFVKRRVLMTDSFPTTTFKATEARGLPSPLPTSGEAKFQLVGEMTVKGVTRPAVWDIAGTIVGNQIKGSAKTRFTFKDFGLTQPKVPVVLSLADTIALEYDFVMTKKTP